MQGGWLTLTDWLVHRNTHFARTLCRWFIWVFIALLRLAVLTDSLPKWSSNAHSQCSASIIIMAENGLNNNNYQLCARGEWAWAGHKATNRSSKFRDRAIKLPKINCGGISVEGKSHEDHRGISGERWLYIMVVRGGALKFIQWQRLFIWRIKKLPRNPYPPLTTTNLQRNASQLMVKRSSSSTPRYHHTIIGLSFHSRVLNTTIHRHHIMAVFQLTVWRSGN